MKKEIFIVREPADIDLCFAWLREHLEHLPFEVTVATEARSRSVNQNRLMWLWNSEIASHMGFTKDEVHYNLKRKFAVPIFVRDDPEYAAMVLAVKAVRKEGMTGRAEALAKVIARLTSTTDFTVEQMREYLTDIEHYAAEIGASLTFPADLYDAK